MFCSQSCQLQEMIFSRFVVQAQCNCGPDIKCNNISLLFSQSIPITFRSIHFYSLFLFLFFVFSVKSDLANDFTDLDDMLCIIVLHSHTKNTLFFHMYVVVRSKLTINTSRIKRKQTKRIFSFIFN